MSKDFLATLDVVRNEIADVNMSMNLTMRAMANQAPAGGAILVSRVKILEPKPFCGARDAKALESYIFYLKQYFKATNTVTEEAKVISTTMHLSEGSLASDSDDKLDQAEREVDQTEEVLEIEFLLEYQVIPMPLTKCLVITGSALIVVQIDIHQPNGLKMISVMQLKKGLARDKPTFMTIPLDSLENLGETVSKDILCVLEKYRDVMPDSLPKSLPPRRMIDHEIELLSDAKLSARNAYRMVALERFVEGFSKRASSLTELLKKDVQWGWTPECQAFFDGLKQAMMKGSVFGITDVTKPFEVETDASDYVLDGQQCRLLYLAKVDFEATRDILREFLQKDLTTQNIMNFAKICMGEDNSMSLAQQASHFKGKTGWMARDIGCKMKLTPTSFRVSR
ncbi:RNA-directed DNA polymerase-like protein [Cucumis melo var. makuwa]|uniref:RNA-directed DNA polymerase-like protein n=1 Tax=Cucumis melo var. makuwa TaxID=1194695 RepID=A0A5A7T2J6_CUCMM|nr:RNA-directed DNA polymerase-like protein [Cucumis melo var. makuwa]TYK09326.1 RNA-directed DNA polymerase-like protein [Cucumis melo var. makuwa]